MLAGATIAAHEGRSAIVMGISGAFLNAGITNVDIKAHIRFNRALITSMLVSIDPGHACFVVEQGASVVDKTFYGC